MARLKFYKYTSKLGRLFYPWNCRLCCGHCGERAGICADCASILPWCRACCVVCGLPIIPKEDIPTICGACQQHKPYFDRLFAPLWYQAPISEFIVNFKYFSQWEHVPLLIELFLDACPKPPPDALLLLVPCHPERVKVRGFNPVYEFIRELRQRMNIEFRGNAIKRIRSTEAQTGKTKRQRQVNVKNAFEVTLDLQGKNIILFDDVVTTGATVNELSKCLKRRGAAYVEVWAIARTKQNINDRSLIC